MLIPIVLNILLASLFDGSQMGPQNYMKKILTWFGCERNNDGASKPAIIIKKHLQRFLCLNCKKMKIADFEYCVSFQTKKKYFLVLFFVVNSHSTNNSYDQYCNATCVILFNMTFVAYFHLFLSHYCMQSKCTVECVKSWVYCLKRHWWLSIADCLGR